MSLYIPPIVRVGQVARADTFEGKLAYVIPSEKSGKKFRQEGAWESWLKSCGEVGRMDFENVPCSGYFINKSISRIRYSSFGSNTQKMRIYNSRGFEFEIDMKNVAMIAQSCDISKGEILQECILAWEGKNIVVLPTTSSEYFELQKEIEKLAEHKENIKEMKKNGVINVQVGDICSCTANKTHYVYIGRGRDINYKKKLESAKLKDFVLIDGVYSLKVDSKEKDLFVACYYNRDDDRFRVYGGTEIEARPISQMIPVGVNISSMKQEKNNLPKLTSEHLDIGGNDLITVSQFFEKERFSYELSYFPSKARQEYRKNNKLKKISYSCFMFNNNLELIKLDIDYTLARYGELNLIVTCENTKTGEKKAKQTTLSSYGSDRDYKDCFSFGLKSTKISTVFEVKKTLE